MYNPEQYVQSHPQLKQSLIDLASWLAPEHEGEHTHWLLGGSCGLLLQGIPLEEAPRDIDLYADGDAVNLLHKQLQAHAVVLDGPEQNETRMYRSILSHYQAGDYKVELVGDFEVRARESYYRVHIDRNLYNHAPVVALNGCSLALMPLAHELIFNLLRDRRDRYERIAEHMAAEPEHHRELVKQIIAANGFHPQMIQRIYKLTGIDN
ncbi:MULTISPECIES: hypothetical protein [Paenibacillus]|uniref:hypothetical protein n=1 Tax=Paenibacillus TaxID=44249 RepID=UPI00036B4C0B|nr:MULTISPECIES: hypothetical protein [Paenibacillus]